MNENTTFFAFAHIPKTAGTSFSEILRRNFNNAYLEITHGLYEGNVQKRNIKLYIEEDASRRAIGGHRISLDLPFNEIEHVKVISISFIRNPIHRIRSEYFYLKSLKRKVKNRNIQNSETYEMFLNNILEDTSELQQVGQYQFSFLTRQSQISSLNNIQEIIDQNRLYLFPVDQFLISNIVLERDFPSDFKDCSYVLLNKGKKGIISNEQIRLEEKLRSKILTLPGNDFELWDMANSFLKRKMNDIPQKEFSKAIRSIKRRNMLREYIITPPQKIINRINTFISGF